MRINTNLNAMKAIKNSNKNVSSSGNSMKKLISGLSINKAADDAAGLAISEKMRSQIRGLNQAEQNAQDGILMLQTAEGTIEEVGNIVQRMRELSVQCANESNSGEDREKINKVTDELRKNGLFKLLKESFFALLSPIIILGCIYSGVASPTEAAVISVFYALILSVFIYKSIEIKEIFDVCVETIRTFAPILFILATSVAFSRVLTLMQVPQIVSEWILTNFSNKIIILLVINLVLLAVGMVMDTTPAILILTPILLPIVTAIGVNPIQFGVIMIVNLAIGFITPPIGINLFVASSLTDVPVMDIAKKSIPMIICFLIALLLFTFIPSISLMLL